MILRSNFIHRTKRVKWNKHKKLVWTLLALFLGVSFYMLFIEPWHVTWGATDSEVSMRLPGDEISPQSKMVITRAITINASVEEVWPWLVQIGQGRGGFYSHERLENLFGCGITNASKILPQFQDLKVGDSIRLTKNPEAPAMPVVAVEKNRRLSLGNQNWLWTFYLEKKGSNSTRLIVRTRADWSSIGPGFANRYLLVPVSFIMERKMMLGLKERAEGKL